MVNAAVLVLGSILFFNACGGGMSNQVNQLPPEDQEFLSTVRYLISKQEKKAFVNLTTTQERSEFIEKFWKQRDPDPNTGINEFKEEYLDRIDTANQLFGRNGWLSDRGRVLIILGPPETKRVYPTGLVTNTMSGEPSIYEYPTEVWYYGYYNFPIVFVDSHRSNSYQLTPLSSQHIATINQAGMMFRPAAMEIKKPMDFKLNITKNGNGQHIIHVELPYKNIVFVESKGTYNADFQLTIKIFTQDGREYPPVSKDYTLSLTKEDLAKDTDNISLSVPLELKPGEYNIEISLENKNDKSKYTKKISFKN